MVTPFPLLLVMPYEDTEWTHFHCYFICLVITPFAHLYIKWRLWGIQGKILLSYNQATQLHRGAMILFVAWRDTLNTNSISCNMKRLLWWPNYMPNVLGIELLGSKCSLYNGMETICSVDKYKPTLHCCWWGQTCAFVLHDVVTIIVNTWSLCHLSGQQCPPLRRAPMLAYRLLRFQNSAVRSSYSAWIQATNELNRFCFWLALHTTPAEKKKAEKKSQSPETILSHSLILRQWDSMHDPLSTHSGRNKNQLVLGMQLPPQQCHATLSQQHAS